MNPESNLMALIIAYTGECWEVVLRSGTGLFENDVTLAKFTDYSQARAYCEAFIDCAKNVDYYEV